MSVVLLLPVLHDIDDSTAYRNECIPVETLPYFLTKKRLNWQNYSTRLSRYFEEHAS